VGACRLAWVARGSIERAGRDELEQRQGRRPRRTTARTVSALVVLGVVIAFIVENGQNVPLHLFGITGHIRLLWLAVICLVVGAAADTLIRRAIRLRFRGRRNKER
jgi:uncharacterized integral membrane protein